MIGFAAQAHDGGFVCDITGLDLSGPIAPDTARALRQLWLDHGVLVFRGLTATPETQLTLSRCFGVLEPHPIPRFRHGDYPELILLSNADGPAGPIYDVDGVPTAQRIPWHTDLAFTTTPNAGALLRMVQRPAEGGQTGWLDTAGAYDALDAATKAQIADLEAVYLFRTGLEDMRFNRPTGARLSPRADNYPSFPPVANPLVWTHPETARKMLNLSTLNIDHVIGMAADAGDALITRLIAHTLDPRFRYIHEWHDDDMVLWDNRRTMHMAFGHPADQIRVVHRTTISGSVAMGRVLPV
ncbi:TauD/TfdA dioxygenase family protein [Novosphingobium sp.]|uniref:TauD/TfdA dioxygenase family protein n=1 Tax=Novosphingobium sp. TaxID=1874826 RepID=UPI003D115C42